MEAITKTFSQDESIDEAVETTNFSIVEVDLLSGLESDHCRNQTCTLSFPSYRKTVSEESEDYQSITGTGRHVDKYKPEQHWNVRWMNRPSRRIVHNSLSFSSSECVTDNDYDDDVYSIPDTEMKKIFHTISSHEPSPLCEQNPHDESDRELLALESRRSKSITNNDRQRTTPVEIEMLLQGASGRSTSADGTKKSISTRFRVSSPTQHLTTNWCGVNLCAQKQSSVMEQPAMDPATKGAAEIVNSKKDTKREENENSPAKRRIYSWLESVTTLKAKSSQCTERSSFCPSKREDRDARSARLMKRMTDRAIHFQQSSTTVKSNVGESQDESVSEDDATEDERSSQAFGTLFTEFWQNPTHFFEDIACVQTSQMHDDRMGTSIASTYVSCTRSESSVGSEEDEEELRIPGPPSFVDPTTSDDSFRSDEQGKQEYRQPMVHILMGLTSKLNIFQNRTHNLFQKRTEAARSPPPKGRDIIESGHSVGKHIQRTVMILSDDDLSEASDLFSDCDENHGLSGAYSNSAKDHDPTPSKPPLYVARQEHLVATKLRPMFMGVITQGNSGYDSESEPSVSFDLSHDDDDDSLIDYAELERELQVEEAKFFCASRSQYHSFSSTPRC